jgi:hypothetical protein
MYKKTTVGASYVSAMTRHSPAKSPLKKKRIAARCTPFFSFIPMKSCWKMNEKKDEVPDIFPHSATVGPPRKGGFIATEKRQN